MLARLGSSLGIAMTSPPPPLCAYLQTLPRCVDAGEAGQSTGHGYEVPLILHDVLRLTLDTLHLAPVGQVSLYREQNINIGSVTMDLPKECVFHCNALTIYVNLQLVVNYFCTMNPFQRVFFNNLNY